MDDVPGSRLLNVARFVPRSAVNGPGERSVLWVQGCGLRCPGCWNADTFSFAPRQLWSAEALFEIIRSTSGIEGVTFTGGEPFAQAAALLPLARLIRSAQLSLVVFTGHELSELRSVSAGALLKEIDLLISGRYVESQRDLTLPLRGSANQQVHFLTDRYGPEHLVPPSAELHIGPDGHIDITGFPDDALRADLSELLSGKGTAEV